MNLYDLQESLPQLFPGKKFTFEFDNTCIEQIEFLKEAESDLFWSVCHVSFHAVLVNDGEKDQKMKINTHRQQLPYKDCLAFLTVQEKFYEPKLPETTADAKA